MNTPAHLIAGLAAFGRPDARRVTAAALAGALVPDLSLYLLAGWALVVQGLPPETVFGRLYYSDAWQTVFRIDNSVPLWTLALVAGGLARRPVLVAFAGAALLHLALDFPLHHDDARAHFWPLTDWIFVSPVSYWDPAHHGRVAGLIEIAGALVLSAWLWRRYPGRLMRALIAALALAELAPGLMFALMMAP